MEENTFRIDKFLKNSGKEKLRMTEWGNSLIFQGYTKDDIFISIDFSYDNNQRTGKYDYMAILKGIGCVPNTIIKEDWVNFLESLKTINYI